MTERTEGETLLFASSAFLVRKSIGKYQIFDDRRCFHSRAIPHKCDEIFEKALKIIERFVERTSYNKSRLVLWMTHIRASERKEEATAFSKATFHRVAILTSISLILKTGS